VDGSALVAKPKLLQEGKGQNINTQWKKKTKIIYGALIVRSQDTQRRNDESYMANLQERNG